MWCRVLLFLFVFSWMFPAFANKNDQIAKLKREAEWYRMKSTISQLRLKLYKLEQQQKQNRASIQTLQKQVRTLLAMVARLRKAPTSRPVRKMTRKAVPRNNPRTRKPVLLAPTLGKGNVKDTVWLIADFVSPKSRAASLVLEKLHRAYKGNLRFVFLPYPLSKRSKRALPVTTAALSAHAMGRFWPYFARLFIHFGKWDEAALLKHARALKLQPKQFQQLRRHPAVLRLMKAVLWKTRQSKLKQLPAFLFQNKVYYLKQLPVLLQKVQQVVKKKKRK
jgi:protein-disulfide isomerase